MSGRLDLFNEDMQRCKSSVAKGAAFTYELPVEGSKDIIAPLRQSWLRCANRGLDPSGAFPLADYAEGDAIAGAGGERVLSETAQDFASTLVERIGVAFGDMPCAVLLLDVRCNVLARYVASSGRGDSWLEEFFFSNVFGEHRCGTCAHTIVSRGCGSAVVIGAMHYREALFDAMSVACALVCNDHVVGYLGAFVRPDADTLFDRVFQNQARSMLQIGASAMESVILSETQAQRSHLLDDILSNSLSYVTDGLVTVDFRGGILSANTKARQLLGIEGAAGEALSNVAVTSSHYNMNALMRAGKIMSNVALVFTVGSRKVSLKCDIRPLLSKDKKRVVGNLIRLRQNATDGEDAMRVLRLDDLRGTAKLFLRAKHRALLTAPTYEAILVTGNVGTGKRTLVKAMHLNSHDGLESFSLVNCDDATEGTLETLLFGAIDPDTGEEIVGAYYKANGGTLVLNEIGCLPLNLQAAIMRILDSCEIRRPGKLKPSPVRVKLVAINQANDLQEMVARGVFREDLFYRICAVHIALPDLKDRPEDIMELVSFFIEEFCAESGLLRITCTSRAVRALMSYSWPGNVSQLRYFIRHACYVCKESTIDLSCLPDVLLQEVGAKPSSSVAVADGALSMKAARRSRILSALQNADGNVSNAAKILGISRATLYRWKKEEGIE